MAARTGWLVTINPIVKGTNNGLDFNSNYGFCFDSRSAVGILCQPEWGKLMKLTVYYQTWGALGFRFLHQGKVYRTTRLEDARKVASKEGYDGIEVKQGEVPERPTPKRK